MNLLLLVWNYLKARKLNTFLNVLLLALGMGVIVIVLLFSNQITRNIEDNSKGIDLVVGAKGSPLQLILCNIFHIDLPTGNIPLFQAERLARHPLVKQAIPMSLGDSYAGYRIVGTARTYPQHYQAELSTGRWWQQPLEVTVGSNVASLAGLSVGDHFHSAHGVSSDGHAHEDHDYVVVGIMGPTHGVIDNLILTSVESMWIVHDLMHAGDSAQQAPSTLVPSVSSKDSTLEITSLLIQYRSAMGAIQLPRLVNATTSLQAASPAFESARLFSIVGVGVEVLQAFGYLLILISALSIFIALYNSLKERRYDLAIMRALGASRGKLVVTLLTEGMLLSLTGSLLGLLLAHGVVEILSSSVPAFQKTGITGLVFLGEEWIILGGSLLLGILCALIPAVQAYRVDISEVLSGS